jgi:Flp pilus assembly protein TadB
VSAQPWGGPVDDRLRPAHRHRSRLIGWALAAFGAGGGRRRALETAVPEVLDVLRATVAAGSSPGQGLAAAADVSEGPLADVLAEAVAAHGIGTPAGQALADAGRRAGLPELALAGEALELASRTGAPSARVLAGVAVAGSGRARPWPRPPPRPACPRG